jgi:hypothetical protein
LGAEANATPAQLVLVMTRLWPQQEKESRLVDGVNILAAQNTQV